MAQPAIIAVADTFGRFGRFSAATGTIWHGAEARLSADHIWQDRDISAGDLRRFGFHCFGQNRIDRRGMVS